MKQSSEDVLDELGTLQEYLEETIQQWRKKVSSIDKSFNKKYGLLFEERRRIVLGEVEPADASAATERNGDETAGGTRDSNEKGLPNFWLTVLKNQDTTSEFVEERDEPALRHLVDIRCLPPKEDPGYRLEFHFSKNPYFSDKVLVKEVHLPSEEASLSSAIVKPTPGIQWKSQGVNLTLRAVTKAHKQKKGGKGKGRKGGAAETPVAETRYKPCASFFGFFLADTRRQRARGRQRHAESEDDEEGDDAVEEEADEPNDSGEDGDGHLISEKQARLLQAICSQVVPNAVEVYLSGGLVGNDTGMDGNQNGPLSLEDHPPAAQRWLRALLHLHAQRQELQKARVVEMERAQASCDEELASAYARRRKLVVGKRAGETGQEEEAAEDAEPPPMNLPRFWLLVLKGCPTTVELIRRRDEAVLEYLADVRCVRSGLATFRVEFEFFPNPFFSDALLAKEFTLDSDEELLTDSRATPIDWRDPETDATIRLVSSAHGTRTKPTPSFFHLFGEGAKALQMLFAGDDRVQLSAPKLLELETNLAVALRDMVVPDALAMYRSALSYDMPDSDTDDDDDDVDEDEEGLDPDELKKRLKARAKRRKDEGGKAVCCGLSKTAVLVVLLVLPMTAQLMVYMDIWNSRPRFW